MASPFLMTVPVKRKRRPWLVARSRILLPIWNIGFCLSMWMMAESYATPEGKVRYFWDALRSSYWLAMAPIRGAAERFPIVPPLAWACLLIASLSFWFGAMVDHCLPSTLTRNTSLPKRAWVLFGVTSLLNLLTLVMTIVILFAPHKTSIKQMSGPISLGPDLGFRPLFALPMATSTADRVFEILSTITSWLGPSTWLCVAIDVVGFYRIRRRISDEGEYTLPVPQWHTKETAAYLRQLAARAARSYRAWRLSLTVRRAVSFSVITWVVIAFLLQRPSVVLWVVAAIALAIFLLNWMFPGVRNMRWLLLGTLCLVALWQWVGSLRNGTQLYDLAAFALAVAVSLAMPRLVAAVKKNRDSNAKAGPSQFRRFVLLIALTWLFGSVTDWLAAGAPASLHPQRFSVVRQTALYPDKRVGVALSGGGYRAALVHAGALAALERLYIPATNLSTVSGGSIFGTYYALGGSATDFLDMASQQELNLRRQALDAQNLGRLILPLEVPGTRVRLLPINFSFTRTELHAGFLEQRLLSHRTFGDIGKAGSPELMICATDLQTGEAIGVARDFVLSRFMLNPYAGGVFDNPDKLLTRAKAFGMDSKKYDSAFRDSNNFAKPLAPMVAASAAFPGVFPSGRFSFEGATYDLSDGGLTDNTGLILLLDAAKDAPAHQHAGWNLDLAISVDAGAYYRRKGGGGYQDAQSEPELQRAYNIMQGQVGRALPDNLQQNSPRRILLSPSLYLENRGQETPFPALDKEILGRTGASDAFHFVRLGESENLDLLTLIAASVLNADRHSLTILDDIYRTLPTELWEKARSYYTNPEASFSVAPLPSGLWSTDPAKLDELRNALERHEQLSANQRLSLDTLQERRETMEKIAKVMIEDFARCLKAFAETSTLEATIPVARAERLYRLGQYLVLFNAPDIRAALGNPPEAKHPIDIAPGQLDFLNATKGKLWFYSPILTPAQQSYVMCRLQIPAFLTDTEESSRQNACRRRFATPGQLAAGLEPF